MSDAQAVPRPPGRWLTWTLLGAWSLVYLSCLAQAGWRLDPGFGVMGYGFPGLDVLNRHGAAVPKLVHQGDWHRLVLDPLVNTSLIGFVFTLWLWSSLGGMLLQLAGAARTWIVFLAGGAAGAFAHAWQHPTLPFAGSGASGAIMAATGALLLFGLVNTGPIAQMARRRAIGYLIAIVIFTALFALLTGSSLVAMGTFEIYALVAGLVAGALAMVAFGARRIPAPPGAVVRGVAFALVGLLGCGLWIQLPRALAGGGSMDTRIDYVQKIVRVERSAWAVKTAHAKAGISRAAQLEDTRIQRADLEQAIAAVRNLPWLETFDGRDALFAYLDTFLGFVRLDYKLLSIQIARMKQAWAAYQPFENRLLLEAGVPHREENVWSSEFGK